MEKYEIEFVSRAEALGNYSLALISMLTGLPADEIAGKIPQRLRKDGGWYGRDFIEVFRQLGYNCSPRFIPFDQNTAYPCLLRFGPREHEVARARRAGEKPPDWWAVIVYYDGLCYDPNGTDEDVVPFHLSRFNPDLKVTSMLQVWMSDTSTLLPSER